MHLSRVSKSPLYTQTHSEYETTLPLKSSVCLLLYLALVHEICLLTFNTQAAGPQQLTRLRAWSCPLPGATLYPTAPSPAPSLNYSRPAAQRTHHLSPTPSPRASIPARFSFLSLVQYYPHPFTGSLFSGLGGQKYGQGLWEGAT